MTARCARRASRCRSDKATGGSPMRKMLFAIVGAGAFIWSGSASAVLRDNPTVTDDSHAIPTTTLKLKKTNEQQTGDKPQPPGKTTPPSRVDTSKEKPPKRPVTTSGTSKPQIHQGAGS